MARQVFQMIDKDNSGTLVKAEMMPRAASSWPGLQPARASRLTRHRRDTVLTARSPRSVEAVSEQSNPVVLFLINCGNENLAIKSLVFDRHGDGRHRHG